MITLRLFLEHIFGTFLALSFMRKVMNGINDQSTNGLVAILQQRLELTPTVPLRADYVIQSLQT